MGSARYKEIIRQVFSASGDTRLPEEVDRIASRFEQEFGTPVLPARHETAAVAINAPKTAALLFDRVWYPKPWKFSPSVPRDVQFYGATKYELLMIAIMELVKQDEQGPVTFKIQEFGRIARLKEDPDLISNLPVVFNHFTSDIAKAILTERTVSATPMYESEGNMGREFNGGDTPVLMCAIQNLKVIDEDQLDWAQVVQFRSDANAKIKLRRLRNWATTLDARLSEAQLTDLLGAKLHDYERALDKHGVQTRLGTISEALDPRVLAASGAAVAGLGFALGPLGAVLGIAGIVVGNAVVSLARKNLELDDLRDGQGSEIAFIHELKRLTPASDVVVM